MSADSNQSGIVMTALMPHAPILLPEIGAGREAEAAATVAALRTVGERIVAARPDRIVLISPHSPRQSGVIGCWAGDPLRGDFERFGHPEVRVEAAADPVFCAGLSANGIQTWEITGEALDHGAAVPLAVLNRAGWQGATVITGLGHPANSLRRELGAALARTAQQLGGRTVVIASGDMSHALQPGAPGGHDPRGAEFDREFVELLRGRDDAQLAAIDPVLQDAACEDVVDSTVIATEAVGGRTSGREVLSYEGPFGVGYSVAVLFDDSR